MLTISMDIQEQKTEKLITLKIPFDYTLIDIAKKLPNIRWNAGKKVWTLPYSLQALELAKSIFYQIAIIDDTAIQEFQRTEEQNKRIDMAYSDKIDNFRRWLTHRRYSENTVDAYTDAVRIFLKFMAGKTVEEINANDVIDFTTEYILKKGYSASYQNQIINGIKLFFSTIEKRKLVIEEIQRPRRQKKLPSVLSKEEVKKILEAPINLKHRAMLSLIYACGLRRGELLKLKTQDILADRGLLHIKQSKGKKDRVVPLSEKILDILRAYYKTHRPTIWLFEGQVAGQPYSEKSLESVLKQAVSRARITKPVTLHWLRHSYATHLLESGTDLRYIQELLGHNSSRTTEIYTHVSRKNIQQIRSPFDDL
jgi:integrase/recombinase XerD